MDRRQTFFVIAFVLVVVIGGYALYALFFARPAAEETPAVNTTNYVPIVGLNLANNAPPTNAAPTTNGLPPTNVTPPPLTPPTRPTAPATPTAPQFAPVEPIVASPTVGATLTSGGTVNLYNGEDGRFYRITADGTAQPLSNKRFFNVSAATFDRSGDKAVIEYPDGANIVYDFRTSKQVSLPSHWEGFDFDASGERLVAKSVGLDANNRFLVIANADGSEVRAVQELGNNSDNVTVTWSPNGQVVGFADTAPTCGIDCTELYLIGQNKERFDKLRVPGHDFRAEWSPSGDSILFSVMSSTSAWRPQLWVASGAPSSIGEGRRSFQVNTWADKCTFADETTVYCAVPRDVPEGAGLQPSVATTSGDDLYRIDVTTGLMTVVARPQGTQSFDRIMVAPDDSAIYATNSATGFLFRIEL
jgi:hypothetical protein